MRLLYIFVPIFCFWIGCKWKQGDIDDVNEAKLGLEKVVFDAKTEFRKFKAGTKHDSGPDFELDGIKAFYLVKRPGYPTGPESVCATSRTPCDVARLGVFGVV